MPHRALSRRIISFRYSRRTLRGVLFNRAKEAICGTAHWISGEGIGGNN
jgi:hypothetical protein